MRTLSPVVRCGATSPRYGCGEIPHHAGTPTLGRNEPCASAKQMRPRWEEKGSGGRQSTAGEGACDGAVQTPRRSAADRGGDRSLTGATLPPASGVVRSQLPEPIVEERKKAAKGSRRRTRLSGGSGAQFRGHSWGHVDRVECASRFRGDRRVSFAGSGRPVRFSPTRRIPVYRTSGSFAHVSRPALSRRACIYANSPAPTGSAIRRGAGLIAAGGYGFLPRRVEADGRM